MKRSKSSKLQLSLHGFILSLGTTGKANCMRVRWRICDLTLIGYVINKSLWFNAVFRADENFKREYLIP